MSPLMIWKCVGRVSAIGGLVCFDLSSTYKKLFGKGFGGLLAYLFLGLIMWCLILPGKRIRVPEKFQGLVAALIFVVICCISFLLDRFVTEQSDAFSIISYASFALMSLSMSRKSELGFETGFSAFFLSLFAEQLCKINLKLLPIAVLFCSFAIILRHYSESTGVQSQDSPVSGQSLSSTNSQQNSQEESSQATHHSPIFIDVLEESMIDWDSGHNEQDEHPSFLPAVQTHDSTSIIEVPGENMLDSDSEQNAEQDEHPSSLPAESWEQDHVSSGNNALTTPNGWMPRSGEPESSSRAPTGLLRRRTTRWMTPGIANISSIAGATRGQVAPSLLFFFFQNNLRICLYCKV